MNNWLVRSYDAPKINQAIVIAFVHPPELDEKNQLLKKLLILCTGHKELIMS